MFLGGALGAGGAYWQMRGHEQDSRSLRAPEGSAAISGTEKSASSDDGIASSPPAADSRNDNVSSEVKAETIKATKPVVKPAVTVNPCAAAKSDLAAALAAAQKAKDDSLSSAKKTFDDETAEADAKLSALAAARSQAVNDYLTAIALATSKYNSSKSADGYAVYQTEQAAALDGYTKKIAEIVGSESPLLKAKKDAEDKHAAAGASIDIKFISDKNAAEAAYAAKGCE